MERVEYLCSPKSSGNKAILNLNIVKRASENSNQRLNGLLSARQNDFKISEEIVSSRKESGDNTAGVRNVLYLLLAFLYSLKAPDILKSPNKKLRLKTSFLTQLLEGRGNINPSTSRQNIHVNREEILRPKTER